VKACCTVNGGDSYSEPGKGEGESRSTTSKGEGRGKTAAENDLTLKGSFFEKKGVLFVNLPREEGKKARLLKKGEVDQTLAALFLCTGKGGKKGKKTPPDLSRVGKKEKGRPNFAAG